MVASLDSFVNDMKTHYASIKTMVEIANNTHEVLVRNVQNIDNVLEVLDIQTHSIGHAAVLWAKFSTPNMAADFETIFLQTQQFFYNCNCEHIQAIPHIYACVAHDFTKLLISKSQAIRGIPVILQAMRKLQEESGQLTSIHSDLCQLALSAKCFKPILSVLNEDISDINDENGKFDPKEYLTYYYYGGMVYLAIKDFEKSLNFFELCLLIPSCSTSKIMVEAYKKYILVCLLRFGKLMHISKHASSTVSGRNFKQNIVHYSEFANAFAANTSSDLPIVVEKHRDIFLRDKNFGLVKQCITRQVKIRIKRLTKTFMTLSLSDVASRVGLSSPTEAERYLLEMIDNREIFARISQKDGMVCFLDDPEKYNSPTMLKSLQGYMERCMSLETQILRMTDQVMTSPAYVKRVIEQEAKSGKTSGQL